MIDALQESNEPGAFYASSLHNPNLGMGCAVSDRVWNVLGQREPLSKIKHQEPENGLIDVVLLY